MSEPSTTSIPPQPGEVLDYKPVSGSAISGLILGIAFTLAVAVFLPYGLAPTIRWSCRCGPCSLRGGGVAASLIGLLQIAGSEGTRAGKGVAWWGLGLSVVSALGFFAFYFITYLALVHQANEFVMVKDKDEKPNSGFFPRLQEGALNPIQFRQRLSAGPHPQGKEIGRSPQRSIDEGL